MINRIWKILKTVLWDALIYSGIYFGIYLGVGWVSNLILVYFIFLNIVYLITTIYLAVGSAAIPDIIRDLNLSDNLAVDDQREILESVEQKELDFLLDMEDAIKRSSNVLKVAISYIPPILLIALGWLWVGGFMFVFYTMSIIFAREVGERIKPLTEKVKEWQRNVNNDTNGVVGVMIGEVE
jgi:hypothetical protein